MKIKGKKNKIIVDSREPPRVIGILANWNIHCEREALDVGDYESSNAIIERKTVNDFQQMLIQDKLEYYCNNMLKKEGKVPFWVIQGNMNDIDTELTSIKQFWGAITKIGMRYGHTVLGLFPSLDSCMYAVASVTTESEKLGRPYKVSMPRNQPDKKTHLLENVLRVPHDSARDLLDKYDNIPGVFRAVMGGDESVKEVYGIGEKRFEKMRRLLE